MTMKLQKYWRDILVPILHREQPPMIPQAIVQQQQQVLLVKRDNPMLWELPGGNKCLSKINFMFDSKILDHVFHTVDQRTPTGIGPEFNPLILHKPP